MATTTVTTRLLSDDDVTYGIHHLADKDTIPTSPVFATVRKSGGAGSKVINYIEDPDSTPLGEASSQMQESEDVTVELESSGSKQTIDWMVKGIQNEKTQLTVTSTDISVTATGFQTAGAVDFSIYSPNDVFWVTGAADAGSDGLNTAYIVDTVTATDIVTTIAPAATEAAGASITLNTWKAENSTNPTWSIIQASAIDESVVGDIDYQNFTPSTINTISMSIPEEGAVSSTAAFVSEGLTSGAYSGQTYTALPTDRAVSSKKGAQSSIMAYYVNGLDDTCGIKSLDIEINNNFNKDPASACDTYQVRGQLAISGSFAARSFTTNSFKWRNISWNDQRVSLGVKMTHGNSEESFISLERVAITEAPNDTGKGVIATAQCSYQVEYDSTTTRTAAIFTNYE